LNDPINNKFLMHSGSALITSMLN